MVVLVIAIFALREPNGHVSSAGSQKKTASSVAKQTHPPTPTHTSARPTTHPPSTSSDPVAALKRTIPLVVLNNTTTPHLAEQAAQRFESGGWTVSRYANYQNDILSTCAYYNPQIPQAKAAALALQAQFPTIKRVEPQFAELNSYASPVVIILTPDYSPG